MDIFIYIILPKKIVHAALASLTGVKWFSLISEFKTSLERHDYLKP